MGKAVVRSGDLVWDTTRLLGFRDERILFRRVADLKGFSNASEVADYRYLRWIKYGEIPQFVQDFCLDAWAQSQESPLPRRLAS